MTASVIARHVGARYNSKGEYLGLFEAHDINKHIFIYLLIYRSDQIKRHMSVRGRRGVVVRQWHPTRNTKCFLYVSEKCTVTN